MADEWPGTEVSRDQQQSGDWPGTQISKEEPDSTSTPETNKALAEIPADETLPQQLMRVTRGIRENIPAWLRVAQSNVQKELQRPSPQWLQPFERSVRSAATTPFLPSAAQLQGLRAAVGLPDQPAAGSHLVETLYDPVQRAATLENAAVAASFIQPEIGAAITSAYLAPSVVPTAKKIGQLPQMTPEEGLKFGMEFWPIVAAPFIHGPEPAFKPSRFTGFPEEPGDPDAPPPQQAPPSGPVPFSPHDVQTQKDLSAIGGVFTDEALSKHFPNHELDELRALGVIRDDPGTGLFEVNPPARPTEQPDIVEKINEGLKAGEVNVDDIPAEETPEQEAQRLSAEERLRNAQDRLGVYGVTPINTDGMTVEEAAKVLEYQEGRLPLAERQASLKLGKTIQENRIAGQLRDQFMDQASGRRGGTTDLNRQVVSLPHFDVTEEPGGGFRVRSGPYDEMVEIPPQQPRGRPTIQKRTVPGADLFLDREGGELQPYASAKRSTAKVPEPEVRTQVGEKARVRQPGTTTGAQEPVPGGVGAVAPEDTPGTTEETPDSGVTPRYVVRETAKGAVVKDQQTNTNVASFESHDLHPEPETLATLRQQAREHADQRQRQLEQGFAGQGGRGPRVSGPETPKPAPGPDIAGQGGGRPAPEPEPEPGVGGTPMPGKPKGRPWQRIGTNPMRYQHRDEPNLRLEQNTSKKGGYDVVDMRGGKRRVIDHFDDRATAQAAYLHGRFSRPDLPEQAEGEVMPGVNPTNSRIAATYDYSDISGFQRAIRQIHDRDPTPEEIEKLKPIVELYKKARQESVKATNQAMAKVAQHFKNVKDISFDDAVQQVKDAIEQATKPCG